MNTHLVTLRYSVCNLKHIGASSIDVAWSTNLGTVHEKEALQAWLEATFPGPEHILVKSTYEWYIIFPGDLNNERLLIFKMRWHDAKSFAE